MSVEQWVSLRHHFGRYLISLYPQQLFKNSQKEDFLWESGCHIAKQQIVLEFRSQLRRYVGQKWHVTS
tara:strand:+ start:6687 stop:6890 length:204 start_codon:yes stop_codon:yes gene_type:complete